MHKKLILIISIVFFAGSLSAQERYFVYFKDKGSNSLGRLNKASAEYKQAEESLSKRSIERRKKVMGENYITYEDLPLSASYVDIIKNYGVQIHRELKWFNAVSCYLTEEQIKNIIILPFVEKIEKVRKLKRVEPKSKQNNDEGSLLQLKKTNYNYNYGNSLPQFELSDIPIVHDAGITGEGVIIGIMDTGFNWKNHPALSGAKVIAEHDFIFDDNNTANEPADHPEQHNHGTYVMSLIGGFSDGNIIGAAFSSSFALAKTEDIRSETHTEEDNYAAALEWMDSIGVDISTSSLGYSEFDSGQSSYTYSQMDGKTTIVAQAANLAFERGITTVTSAGNEGNGPWHYITSPGDAFDIITVGAVNNSDVLAIFSSRGPTFDKRIKPEVVAQGQGNWGASGTSYASSQGTSFSAPIVAGIIGLLKSTYSHLTNKQIREIVIASGNRADNPNNDYGYGLLSAVRAINYPNIQRTTSGYTLHKIFLNKTISNTGSVKLFYSVNGSEFTEATLNYDGTLKYNYDFNSVSEGDAIEFYFTFNNGGSEEREPAGKNYLLNLENLSVTSVENNNNQIPDNFELSQNYPNPFNPATIIKYNIPEKSFVSLKIFNMLGQEIKSLINSEMDTGNYSVIWNGTNNLGQKVSTGAYVYQMAAGDFVQSKKMVLLK